MTGGAGLRSLAAELLRTAEDDDEMAGLILGSGPERWFVWLDHPGATERPAGSEATWCLRRALDGEGTMQEMTVAEAVAAVGVFLAERILDLADLVLAEFPDLPGRERLIGELPAAHAHLRALLEAAAQVYADGAAAMLRRRAQLDVVDAGE